MDAPFSFHTQPGRKDGTQILTLTGPLTLNSMFSFQNEFRAMRPPVLIVDMTECPYIDSAGLGLLMNQYVSAENGQRTFLLAGVNSRVEAIMASTRVKAILSLFPTVESAEASI